jgi:putative restriction endonuclease
VRAFVAVTDREWFEQLRHAGELDDVNFWQPSAGGGFRALVPGELFLFKLHSPDNFIVGGGLFSHWTRLRVSFAWEAFQQRNGAESLLQMRARIERYRRIKPHPHEDYEIGCILIQDPFFFARDDWLPVPDWQVNIVRGKTYQRRCAVTGEKALPVLQAAHIRPYAEGGDHRVDNGLLLRSDLHILFDRGYVTVTPAYRLEVSRRLRTEFENGEEYLARHGQAIWVPSKPKLRPSPEFLSWHNEHRFVGRS